MAAEIHQLPRFAGEHARRLPSAGEEIAYAEALRILADRANEWRARLDGILQHGDYLMRDDGRDHVLVDGATLQACGEDIQALAKHLRNLAAQIEAAE
jgi:hypothetical protein